MRLRAVHDVAAAADAVADLVRADDAAAGSVLLGVLRDAAAGSSPTTRLWVVEDGGDVVAAWCRTRPHPYLVVARGDRSATELGRAAAGARLAPSQLTAREGVADAVARGWAAAIGGSATQLNAMRTMRCRELEAPRPAPGRHRPASPAELDEVIALERDFQREALPDARLDEEELRGRLTRRVAAGAVHLWVDGDEVVGSATAVDVGDHVRIAMVYTPPARRGRGYAGGLVAALTAAALDRGDDEVVLFADVANPISTALYERLGYVGGGLVTTWRVAGRGAGVR